MKRSELERLKEEQLKVPRCRQCQSRLTVLEDMYGKQRLWCINCEAPFMK